MSVMTKKSVCVDCNGKDSCQKLKKLHEMCDSKRTNPARSNDVFDVVVLNCSLKNYDRSYKLRSGDGREGMYYCTLCHSMHHEVSRIGVFHKKLGGNSELGGNSGYESNDGYNDDGHVVINKGEINQKET